MAFKTINPCPTCGSHVSEYFIADRPWDPFCSVGRWIRACRNRCAPVDCDSPIPSELEG